MAPLESFASTRDALLKKLGQHCCIGLTYVVPSMEGMFVCSISDNRVIASTKRKKIAKNSNLGISI